MTNFRVSELLAKQVLGTLTEEEQQELHGWLTKKESRRQLADRVSAPDFIANACNSNSRAAAQRSWKKMCTKVRPQTTYRSSWRIWRAVAAVLLCCLLTGAGYLWLRTQEDTVLVAGTEKAIITQPDGEKTPMTSPLSLVRQTETELSPTSPTIVEVPRGGKYSLTLPDGTEVYLNADSRLEIPADFSDRHRRIYFQGEGYFRVSKNALSPFDVNMGKVSVRVYGTEFNLKHYSDHPTEVTLVKGYVGVSSQSAERRLSPGEQAHVEPQGEVKINKVNTYLACAWYENRIAYENAYLVDILQELGRWYDFETSFSSDRLRYLRFTIDMDREHAFNDIAELLKHTNTLSIKIRDKHVLISEP